MNKGKKTSNPPRAPKGEIPPQALRRLPAVLMVVKNSKATYVSVPPEMKPISEKALAGHAVSALSGGTIEIPKGRFGGRMVFFSVKACPGGEFVILGFDCTNECGKMRELEERIEQLDKFRRLAVGRELTVMELKRQIEVLKRSIEGEHG